MPRLYMPRRRIYRRTRRPTRMYRRKTMYSPSLQRMAGRTSRLLTAPGSRYQFVRMIARNQAFRPTAWQELTYCQTFGISSSAATNILGTEQAFRLNSLYDPDLTGAGHQPYYFDQLTGQYTGYRVYEVAWRITAWSPSVTTQAVAVLATSSADTYTLTGQTASYIDEKPNGFYERIGDGSQPLTCVGSRKIWEIEGISFNHWLGNPAYEATIGASPTQCPLLHIAVNDWASSVGSQNVSFDVRLYFKCAFFGRTAVSYS